MRSRRQLSLAAAFFSGLAVVSAFSVFVSSFFAVPSPSEASRFRDPRP